MSEPTTNVGYGYRPIEKWEEGCECFNSSLRDWFTCQWGQDCRQIKRLRILPGDGYEIVGEDEVPPRDSEITYIGLWKDWRPFILMTGMEGKPVRELLNCLTQPCAIRRPITKEKEQPIMSENKPCCAHQRVHYRRIKNANGTESDAWYCYDCEKRFWPESKELQWLPRTPESNPQHPFVALHENGLSCCGSDSIQDNIKHYPSCWNKFMQLPPPPVEVPEWEKVFKQYYWSKEENESTHGEKYESDYKETVKHMLRAAACNPSILEPFKEKE